MVILQAGRAKSGNFWLYNIIQSLLVTSGVNQKRFIIHQPIYEKIDRSQLANSQQAEIDTIDIRPDGCDYILGPFYRQSITDFNHYLMSTTHVWTHSIWHNDCSGIYNKFDKIIYIIRDPRDVAISMSEFAFTPYMQNWPHPHREKNPKSYLKHHIYSMTIKWVMHVCSYLHHAENDKVFIIFYENLLHEFESQVASLANFIEIDIPTAGIRQLEEQLSIERMRNDNPQHVRKGLSGGWRDSLSEKQNQRVITIAGPLLDLLGYPLTPQQYSLPHPPSAIDNHQLDEIESSSHGNIINQLIYAYYFFVSRRPIRDKLFKGLAFIKHQFCE